VHERGLEQVQSEHRRLGVLLVRAGQGAVLAVVEHGVRTVPVLHDLEAAVDLATQAGAGEVVAGKDRTNRVPQFFEGLVGGVLGAAAGEAPERGGVLDLVVLLLDQLPADRPCQRGAERGPAGWGVVRAVQADAADVVRTGQQAEVIGRRVDLTRQQDPLVRPPGLAFARALPDPAPPPPAAGAQLVELLPSQMTVVQMYLTLARAGETKALPAEGLVEQVRDAVHDRAAWRWRLRLTPGQMGSVAYALWLRQVTGSAAEARRFARDYGHCHVVGCVEIWRRVRVWCCWVLGLWSDRGGSAGSAGGLVPDGEADGHLGWRWGRKRGEMPLNADRNRWAPPMLRKPFIARSRCRVGWWEFSARLFSPLCERCPTEGMTSRWAAP
jgi:hypothetical protein